MNSKKIKNRYEKSTIFLKQNIKSQIPFKLSDKENQTNYRKNSSNISSKTNIINNKSKNTNTKVNQNLNRANSSINNSKIIITNNNTSLYNNNPNNKQNNSSIKLEKNISPMNQNKNKVNNKNNNSFKHLNKEIKNLNFKYIFDTYDNDIEDGKKTSILFIRTEESKKNNSSKEKSPKKKKLSDNINYIKNMTQANINNVNLNIFKNKKNLEVKTNLKFNEEKNIFTKNDSANNSKNIYNNFLSVPNSDFNEPIIYINNEKNENKIIEDKNILSKSAQKCEINNFVDNNKLIKNQIIIKFNNQINRIRGKSPRNENSNITEINGKEITFSNNNLININNIISDIDTNLKSKKNDKKNNIKKSIIKFTKQNKNMKGKKNYSTNKIKNLEKQNYFSNKNLNNNNNNDKNYNKKIEKESNIKIPILEKFVENKVNINKMTDKIIERKISDNDVNSVRKKEMKIYEKLNRQNNFINKEQKSPIHQHQNININLNDINIKNEKELKNNIKTLKNNYIKKIDNNSKKYNKNKYNLKGSSKLRVNSVKGNNNNYNRIFQKQRYKSNCNSESKKNYKHYNFNSKNNIRGYSTLSNRIKSLSFQNNQLNNNDFFKYHNEFKNDEKIDNNNNKIYTEENKNDIKINVNNCTIIINISSNWGNKKYLGINEIELFDKKNRKIKVSECIVIGGNGQNINNLFNNKMHTMNENNMWVTNIRNQKSSYDLKIKLVIYTRTKNNIKDKNEKNSDDLFNEISYILIWNYNGIELNKGIKKIEVLDKYGNVYFVGIVSKGEHSITNYHPYKIKIHQNKNNNNKYEGFLARNKNLLYSYKHDTEQTLESNKNQNNFSIGQQNNKKNDSLNDNEKMIYYSVIRLSSKKEEVYSEIKELFPSNLNFNQVSSSRSCHKDIIIGNKLASNKINENKNYKKISNIKNRRIIYDKKNKNQDKKENKIKNEDSQSNIIYQNKRSKECLLDINLKPIIPEEKEIIKEDNTTQNNNSNIIIKNMNNNPLKSEYYIDNKISILSLSESQNMLLFKRNNSDNTLPYILFQNIKINILSNYGNKSFVGLTGLNLIDMHNKIISIEDALSIGAMPKDLNTIFPNKNDNRIFENLFNGINNTVNENNMWLTVMNPYPYIEIWFKKPMTLSKLQIWNYNAVFNLDKGAKEIEIMFDSDENRKYYFMLWKGLGIDYFDYYQTIFVDKLPEITKKTIQLKYNHLKFKYNTNYLPIGFIIKIIFVKNYGNNKIISLKSIEFFDENNKKLDKYKVICEKINKNKKIKNNYFYYHELYDFRRNENSLCNNIIFICFEEIVQIKYIRIQNTNIENLINTSTKDIQIFLDDILIFEGVLNQKGESILLFDKKEIINFKNIVNIKKKESKYIFKEINNDKYHLLTNINT